jgi:hypothetical protein
MTPTVGQTVTITGPDGSQRRGRILNAYRSTGGFLSIWVELDDCFANPANDVAGECMTQALVLTERDGIYRDLWQGRWELGNIEFG